MNTIDAIKQRRAVKHFDPSYLISEDDKKILFNTVKLSPSSFNIQHWRFCIVEDKKLREEVRAAAWNQAQITEASLLIIICADVHAWKKSPERYWQSAPETIRNSLVGMIGPFYEGKDQLQRDEAMRSVGLCAQTLMLTAKELGYDSCPMIGFDSEKVANIINLPSDHAIGMIVVIGKAIKEAQPKGGFLADNEIFITDKF